jgi:hypothetical protein
MLIVTAIAKATVIRKRNKISLTLRKTRKMRKERRKIRVISL